LEVVNPDVIGAPDKNGTRWMQVRLPDDRSAYLQAGDVSTDNPKLNIRQMIELSHKFIGLPYLWGGVSTFGFDCSGFTQMLLRQRGILMPRDAGPQAAWSGVVPVPRSNLRPGDLLFFGDSATKITHTGLYIGNGEFINATAHGRPIVQIERLSDPYRAHALVAARRPK
jgi:cell wall-associated NlpC family hydrolase